MKLVLTDKQRGFIMQLLQRQIDKHNNILRSYDVRPAEYIALQDWHRDELAQCMECLEALKTERDRALIDFCHQFGEVVENDDDQFNVDPIVWLDEAWDATVAVTPDDSEGVEIVIKS